MANRANYVTLEAMKRSARIPDTASDIDIKAAIQAATDVMPRQFYVTVGARYFMSRWYDHVLLKGSDLLSVTEIATDDGTRTYPYVWSGSPLHYDLEPYNALFEIPPHPYWRINRIGGLADYSFPVKRARGVRVTGKWGFYEVFSSTTFAVSAVLAAGETQRLTPSGTVSGGTFTLTFAGQTTVALDYDSTAAEIQAAVVALSNIAVGDIVCAGGPINSAFVSVTFGGALAGIDVASLTVDGALLTGSTPVITASMTVSPVTFTVPSGIVETGNTLAIEDEQVFVTAVAGTTATVERAVNGTTAASHAVGQTVRIYSYPLVEEATHILAMKYLRRIEDAPMGIVGGMDGFMRVAINDPQVQELVGRLVRAGVA